MRRVIQINPLLEMSESFCFVSSRRSRHSILACKRVFTTCHLQHSIPAKPARSNVIAAFCHTYARRIPKRLLARPRLHNHNWVQCHHSPHISPIQASEVTRITFHQASIQPLHMNECVCAHARRGEGECSSTGCLPIASRDLIT